MRPGRSRIGTAFLTVVDWHPEVEQGRKTVRVAKKLRLDPADEEAWERRGRKWRVMALVVVVVICIAVVVALGIWIWDHHHASYGNSLSGRPFWSQAVP